MSTPYFSLMQGPDRKVPRAKYTGDKPYPEDGPLEGTKLKKKAAKRPRGEDDIALAGGPSQASLSGAMGPPPPKRYQTRAAGRGLAVNQEASTPAVAAEAGPSTVAPASKKVMIRISRAQLATLPSRAAGKPPSEPLENEPSSSSQKAGSGSGPVGEPGPGTGKRGKAAAKGKGVARSQPSTAAQQPSTGRRPAPRYRHQETEKEEIEEEEEMAQAISQPTTTAAPRPRPPLPTSRPTLASSGRTPLPTGRPYASNTQPSQPLQPPAVKMPRPRTSGNGNMVTTASTRFVGVNYAKPDAKLMRGESWTEEEDIRLIELREAGHKYKVIAAEHLTRHTQAACENRYQRIKHRLQIPQPAAPSADTSTAPPATSSTRAQTTRASTAAAKEAASTTTKSRATTAAAKKTASTTRTSRAATAAAAASPPAAAPTSSSPAAQSESESEAEQDHYEDQESQDLEEEGNEDQDLEEQGDEDQDSEEQGDEDQQDSEDQDDQKEEQD